MSRGCFTDGSAEIAASIEFICLIILLMILTISIKELLSRQKIKPVIKLIYCTAIISSIIGVAWLIVLSFICIDAYDLIRSVFYITYGIVCLCVSGILLSRLYFTFNDSFLRLSPCQKWFIIIGYSLGIICIALISFNNVYIRLIGMLSGIFIYFGLSIYGMISFTQKMYKLTKLNESNKRQNKLLYSTAKYLSLLSFAMLSSWIAMLISIVENVINEGKTREERGWFTLVNTIISCIDFVINIGCLYLQYPFAKKYYDKYCTFCGNFCLYLLVRNKEKRNEINNQKHGDQSSCIEERTKSMEVDTSGETTQIARNTSTHL